MPYHLIASLAASQVETVQDDSGVSLFKNQSLQQGLLHAFSNRELQDRIGDLNDSLEQMACQRLKTMIELESCQKRIFEISSLQHTECDMSDAYKRPSVSLYWISNKSKLLHEKEILTKKVDPLKQVLSSLTVRINECESLLKAEYKKLEDSTKTLKTRIECYKNRSHTDQFFSTRADELTGDDQEDSNQSAYRQVL